MIEYFICKVINKLRSIIKKIINKKVTKKVNNENFRYGINKRKRNLPEVVVSFTSYPKRFDGLEICIKSILNQTFKPDRIILWLGSDTPKEIADKYLQKYLKYGVEYYIDDRNNYLSHKKYIYAFKKFSNSIIITLDDDLIYPANTIETLIRKYKKHPNCIIARRVHKITFDKNKTIKKYNKWIRECFYIRKPSNRLCATTGAGTLFPPSIYKSEDVINYDLIKEYAMTADDIWLKMMAIKDNIKILWAGNFFQMPPVIDNKDNINLADVNVAQNKNDIYIEKIMKDYNISFKDFK